ncbi:putative helicase-associated [Plasmopara halstedii]
MLRFSVRQVWRFSNIFQIDSQRIPHTRFFLHNVHIERISNLTGRKRVVGRKAGRLSRLSAYEEDMLACFKTYKEKMGDLLVPQAFIVPSGDSSWPNTQWGRRLGRAVNRIRKLLKFQATEQIMSAEMIEGLHEIGFVQDVTQYKWDHEVLPSLRQFEKLHGNSDVPSHFVVPEGDEAWPKAAWGRKLGLTVVDMRAGKTFVSQMVESRSELEKLDFCFTSIPDRDWAEKILPALHVHRQKFGHCVVKQFFKIPSCQPWPTKAWGMPLGHIVRDIRLRKAYLKQATRDKKILNTIDFAWNRSATVWTEQVIPAIRVYSQVFKNGFIQRNFVVPSEDPWPERAWAMKLGTVIGEVRNRGTYFRHFGRDAELLDELGFGLRLSQSAWQNRVAPLLDIYERQYGDSKEISDNFIIPSEAPWPEDMWGVRLGLIVKRNFPQLSTGSVLEKMN